MLGSLSSSSSGAKGVLMFGFLLLIVAGLFFVPDLMNLQGGRPAQRAADSGVNPLERVLSKMNAGYYEGGMRGGKPDSARQQERMAMIDVLQSGPMSWELLHRPEIMGPVARTLKECQTLLKLLDPVKHPRSREALFNYINALNLFFRRDGVPFSSQETVDQLSRLDIEVTEAFITERLGQTEYNVWKAISLGPLLQAHGAEKLKEQYNPPFNADLTLIDVEITERLVRNGKTVQRKSYSINVSGVVSSPDAKELEVYKGHELLRTIRLNMKNVPEGRAKFSFRANDIGPAPFTLKVSDQNGNVFQKRYSFLRGAKRIPRDQEGNFKVPSVIYTDLRRAPDPRLDRIFRAGGGAEGDGFAGGIPGNSFSQPSSDWGSF